MKHFIIHGQISIFSASIGAVGMIVASGFTAWATANGSISELRTSVSVVQEREQNHYLEVQKQLNAIDNKLDKLLQQRPFPQSP